MGCLALQFLMGTSEFVLDANSNFKTMEELFLSELVRNFVSQKKLFQTNFGSDLTVVLKRYFLKIITLLTNSLIAFYVCLSLSEIRDVLLKILISLNLKFYPIEIS